MTIQQILKKATLRLRSLGIKSPALESRLLLKFALKVQTEELLLNPHKILNQNQINDFELLLNDRLNFKPIAYITGNKEFYSLDFFVNENVLIPREDSEVWVTQVIHDYKEQFNAKILELGIGSGCLIISILKSLTQASAIAVDISNQAIEIAKRNALQHKVKNRLTIFQSDWFSNIKEEKFDCIISNPPYVACSDKLDEEVLYEPQIALYTENLESYKKIAESAKRYLKDKLYIEVGANQASLVCDLFLSHGFKLLRQINDLSGFIRCLVFKSIN